MLAYGKLNRDMMSNGYVGCKLGFEFSGFLGDKRIMGVAKQAIATHVFARNYLVGICFQIAVYLLVSQPHLWDVHPFRPDDLSYAHPAAHAAISSAVMHGIFLSIVWKNVLVFWLSATSSASYCASH
jgi:hypothetical protein